MRENQCRMILPLIERARECVQTLSWDINGTPKTKHHQCVRNSNHGLGTCVCACGVEWGDAANAVVQKRLAEGFSQALDAARLMLDAPKVVPVVADPEPIEDPELVVDLNKKEYRK